MSNILKYSFLITLLHAPLERPVALEELQRACRLWDKYNGLAHLKRRQESLNALKDDVIEYEREKEEIVTSWEKMAIACRQIAIYGKEAKKRQVELLKNAAEAYSYAVDLTEEPQRKGALLLAEAELYKEAAGLEENIVGKYDLLENAAFTFHTRAELLIDAQVSRAETGEAWQNTKIAFQSLLDLRLLYPIKDFNEVRVNISCARCEVSWAHANALRFEDAPSAERMEAFRDASIKKQSCAIQEINVYDKVKHLYNAAEALQEILEEYSAQCIRSDVLGQDLLTALQNALAAWQHVVDACAEAASCSLFHLCGEGILAKAEDAAFMCSKYKMHMIRLERALNSQFAVAMSIYIQLISHGSSQAS